MNTRTVCLIVISACVLSACGDIKLARQTQTASLSVSPPPPIQPPVQPPVQPPPPPPPQTSLNPPPGSLNPSDGSGYIAPNHNPLTLGPQYRPPAGSYDSTMIQYATNTLFQYNVGPIEQILTNPGFAPSPNNAPQIVYNVAEPDRPIDPAAPKLTEISIPIVTHGGYLYHGPAYLSSVTYMAGYWIVASGGSSQDGSGGIWVVKEDGSPFPGGQTALIASPQRDIQPKPNSWFDPAFVGIISISATDFIFVSSTYDEIGCGMPNAYSANGCGIFRYHIDAQNSAVTFVGFAPAPIISGSNSEYFAAQVIGTTIVAKIGNDGYDTYSLNLQFISHSTTAPAGYNGLQPSKSITLSNGDSASILGSTNGNRGFSVVVAGKTQQIPHRCDGSFRLGNRQNPVDVYCDGTGYESGNQNVTDAAISPNGYIMMTDNYKAVIDKLTKL